MTQQIDTKYISKTVGNNVLLPKCYKKWKVLNYLFVENSVPSNEYKKLEKDVDDKRRLFKSHKIR